MANSLSLLVLIFYAQTIHTLFSTLDTPGIRITKPGIKAFSFLMSSP